VTNLGELDEAYYELYMLNTDRKKLIYSYTADDTIFDLLYIMEMGVIPVSHIENLR